jgi:hypothetical protein
MVKFQFEFVAAGFDEVATDDGTFTWRSVAPMRSENGEDPSVTRDSAERPSRVVLLSTLDALRECLISFGDSQQLAMHDWIACRLGTFAELGCLSAVGRSVLLHAH